MLRTLKDLFDQLTESLNPPSSGARATDAPTHTLELATAVLLVEVMRTETGLKEAEKDAVLLALHRKFHLSGDERDRLLELAHETARAAYDYQSFTARLNERFTQEQKIQVVEAMWQVAYADGHIAAAENHVIAKVAGLLHVTHGEYIAAKMRAKEDALKNAST
jgi:uncharacterized tellurite resistance protein B-like protein